MRFHFIRHGQSFNNALWSNTGNNLGRSHDPELTDLGRAQAVVLAKFLATVPAGANGQSYDPQNLYGFRLTHLYSSLTLRAVATGHVVAEALGLPLIGWPDVHENGGLYLTNEQTGEHVGHPGCGRSFFAAHYPRLVLPDTLGDEGWYHGRGHEEPHERPARAQRSLEQLVARHGQTDDHVAVISHGGFYNHFLAAVLGLSDMAARFTLNNVAITRIDFEPDGVRFIYQNRADFLPRELVS